MGTWTGRLKSSRIRLLCATQEINWTLFALFQATAAFLLAFAAIIRQRRSRAFRDEELHTLKWRLNVVERRLNVVEACERRRVMESLHDAPRNLIDTNGLVTPAEEAPVAPSE